MSDSDQDSAGFALFEKFRAIDTAVREVDLEGLRKALGDPLMFPLCRGHRDHGRADAGVVTTSLPA